MRLIESSLNSQGFIATRPIEYTDTPCFTGRIKIGSWAVNLELRFLEGKYDYPVAYLSEFPHNTKMRSAFGFRNINSDGKVCYIDESRTWWDSAEAQRLVSGALRLIKNLLNENLRGASEKKVVARDFNGYWHGESTLYIGDHAQNGMVFNQVSEKDSARQWLIPKDSGHWLSVSQTNSCFTPWFVIHLKSPASDLTVDTWPPKNISELFKWLDLNSPQFTSRFLAFLSRGIYKKGLKKKEINVKPIGILLTWPDENKVDVLGCGFSFKIPGIVAQSISQKRLKPSRIYFNKSQDAVKRFTLQRADAHYIQNRNTPNQSSPLKNKKVILVGGGTIGSNLSKLLCSHGAGWGSQGQLHIIDPDSLSVENVGRHLLGMESLGKNKANVLEAHLKGSFPHLSITGHPKSLIKCWNLITDNSIVIDATGYQSVSISIPDYLSEKRLKPLVLHSWIHGHGGATVSFINDRKDRKSACFRCLWKLDGHSYRPKYQLSKTPESDAPVFVGCHQSYHPYASTISLTAATQAMTMLNSYLQKKQASTLQFNILRTDICQNRKDASPEKSKDCPLCNR
jgi:hypothetical protein